MKVSLSYMALTLLVLVHYFFNLNLLISTFFLFLLIGIYLNKFIANHINIQNPLKNYLNIQFRSRIIFICGWYSLDLF